jgi:hypothetical protein
MQIFLEKEEVSTIYQRMLSLHISKEFARDQKNDFITALTQDSEQENSRRELLPVEAKAKKEKIIALHGEQHFRAQINNQLYSKILAQLNQDLTDTERLYYHILRVDDASVAILDLLAVRAASISRIKPLVNTLSWLSDDLIRLVNKPQYRKRADVQIHNVNVALSYVGLDNLKLLMPTFILKHYLPNSTMPFSLMRRKLWNDSLAIGLATSTLAEQQGLDNYTAFTTGLFSNLGLLTVTRCFFNAYNKVHAFEVKKAFENKDRRLHDILLSIKPDASILLNQLTQHSARIGAELVEQMNFERLLITEPLFDLAYITNFTKMHPIAQLTTKAQGYVTFRNLAKEGLINSDEAKKLLASAKLTPDDIALLKKSDIDHLKLKFT